MRTVGKINGVPVFKVRAIVLGYIHVDFIVLDPAISELLFYFKHDVGGSVIIIFIGKPDVENIDNAILVLFLRQRRN